MVRGRSMPKRLSREARVVGLIPRMAAAPPEPETFQQLALVWGTIPALTAHYTETVTWERFTLDVSILYLAMIIVGGLGSIAGAVYGAIFMGLLPPLLTELVDLLSGSLPALADQLPAIRNAFFGLAIIIFLLFEPRGLDRIWSRLKDYIRFWPFRY